MRNVAVDFNTHIHISKILYVSPPIIGTNYKKCIAEKLLLHKFHLTDDRNLSYKHPKMVDISSEVFCFMYVL
jgi:hypothetical protein